MELWLALVHNRSVLDPSLVARGGQTSDQVMVSLVVPNTGQSEPLLAQFPFSHRLVAILNAPKTRQSLEDEVQKSAANPYLVMDKVCETIFGADCVRAWETRFGDVHEAYLHDFVAQIAPVFPHVSFDLQLATFRTMLAASEHAALSSPGRIHVGYWAHESVLYHLCSLFNSLPRLQTQFFELLQRDHANVAQLVNHAVEYLVKQTSSAHPGGLPENFWQVGRLVGWLVGWLVGYER